MTEGDAEKRWWEIGYARRLLAITPLVVGVLCVLAVYPWMIGAPQDLASTRRLGWAIGLGAIVIYPAALASWFAVGANLSNRKLLKSSRWLRHAYWISIALFVCAMALAFVLRFQ